MVRAEHFKRPGVLLIVGVTVLSSSSMWMILLGNKQYETSRPPSAVSPPTPAPPPPVSYLPLDERGFPTLDADGEWAQHIWVCTFGGTGFRFTLGPEGSMQTWSARYDEFVDEGTFQVVKFAANVKSVTKHDEYGKATGTQDVPYVNVRAKVAGGTSDVADQQRSLFRKFHLEVDNLLGVHSYFGDQDPAIYADFKTPDFPSTATCHTIPP